MTSGMTLSHALGRRARVGLGEANYPLATPIGERVVGIKEERER
jgi:hypothetical protein